MHDVLLLTTPLGEISISGSWMNVIWFANWSDFDMLSHFSLSHFFHLIFSRNIHRVLASFFHMVRTPTDKTHHDNNTLIELDDLFVGTWQRHCAAMRVNHLRFSWRFSFGSAIQTQRSIRLFMHISIEISEKLSRTLCNAYSAGGRKNHRR